MRHVSGGAHVPGHYDRDYLSGGQEGYILDVCGDYAQVQTKTIHFCAEISRQGVADADRAVSRQVWWDNGSVRFYFVGRSPYRPDADGADTDNPRAIRSLYLVR